MPRVNKSARGFFVLIHNLVGLAALFAVKLRFTWQAADQNEAMPPSGVAAINLTNVTEKQSFSAK